MTEIAASAPGRVNLIGEHTDYNGGYVLPMALPLETRAVLTLRRDGIVRARTRAEVGGQPSAEYVVGSEQPGRGWIDYVQGVTWALREGGLPAIGFELTIDSDVPAGKGLSSSAALEVAVLRALRKALELALTDLQVAMLAHRAEAQFIGVPVGIMDQMASSLGDGRSALFLDAESLEFSRVPIPRELTIGVVDSGIAHRHADGGYRVRRRECDEAAAALGVATLRAIGPDDLPRVERLKPPLNRRARHVYTENQRVLAAVDALRARDFTSFGALLDRSHASLRDDFNVSLPEIDRLVAIAQAQPGVFGARLTGGGFGGAIVVVCDTNAAADAFPAIEALYRQRIGLDGSVLLPRDLRHNS